ncbi:cytochrome c [Marinobacter sp. JB05H06]|nr:cytochrome c [Marinobacter sp. JB05H06]
MLLILGRKQGLNRLWRAYQRRLQILGVTWVALFLAPGIALGGDAEARPPSEQARLSNLVVQDCGSCHGLTLRGGLGPPLRPEDLAHLPVEAIAAIVSEGVPGSAMPPWKALLSPEEIHWISEQLKSGALVSH